MFLKIILSLLVTGAVLAESVQQFYSQSQTYNPYSYLSGYNTDGLYSGYNTQGGLYSGYGYNAYGLGNYGGVGSSYPYYSSYYPYPTSSYAVYNPYNYNTNNQMPNTNAYSGSGGWNGLVFGGKK
ncbi:prisilkin-39-like [Contarinia nasturtii]|uniref:prisilkin-39-like n=1 Tax=Contarinia nasturtii TaxID=265458 RepID=UPI0012D3B0B8|nr:prisilkin-39-like [Contarinia nasturtii]